MSGTGSEAEYYPSLIHAFTTQFRANSLADHSHLGAMTDGSPRLARRQERFAHGHGYRQIEIDVVGAQYTGSDESACIPGASPSSWYRDEGGFVQLCAQTADGSWAYLADDRGIHSTRMPFLHDGGHSEPTCPVISASDLRHPLNRGALRSLADARDVCFARLLGAKDKVAHSQSGVRGSCAPKCCRRHLLGVGQ